MTYDLPVGRAATGFVVAVTSARQGTAKRGLSTALAVALARTGHAETCLVDIDITARDVAKPFTMTGPTVAELTRLVRDAPHSDVLSHLACDPDSGCLVVPAAAGRVSLDTESYVDVVTSLRDQAGCVVLDAPVAIGTGTRPLDHVGRLLDAIVVAALPDSSDLAAAMTYLGSVARAQAVGSLPPTLRTHLVVTGANGSTTESFAVQRILRGRRDPVLLPQLWGRDAAAPFEHGRLLPALTALIEQLHAPVAGEVA